MKRNITHFYTNSTAVGGPTTYINLINNSQYLSDKYNFSCVYQNKLIYRMSFKDLKRIVSEFKKNSPDIIHIHGLQSEGFVGTLCAKIFGKAKILITVHGMQHDSFNIGVFKKFLFKNILERWTLKNADGVFCVCEAAEKSKYISKNTKHLMHYLHNCVSDMPEYVRETERENLGFKKDDIVLVSVGRVTEGKGAAVVANIIENDKNNNHKYLILGDGPYLKTMKERLAEQISKGKVVFMGSVSDVGRYLSASDVYISATYKENLSIAILEAGYYSLPCIVTPVGGNGEIIENGYNGELFDIEDVDGFFDKLNCILKTGIDKYRANAKENINQRFSIEQFEKGLCDIYNKILDNN